MKKKSFSFYLKSFLITIAALLMILSVLALGVVVLCVGAVLAGIVFIYGVFVYVKNNRRLPHFSFGTKSRKVYEGTYREYDLDLLLIEDADQNPK